MSVMTKEEFKERWESNVSGGGITFNDIADCAKAWGLFRTPKTCRIDRVQYAVLKAADTNDYIEWMPEEGS